MANPRHSTTAPAPAQPGFIDPTTLPDEYAMRVRGDCMGPGIGSGDAVQFDKRQPYAPGDLVGVYLKAECSGGSTNVGLKRLVMNMMPGVTYPYQAHPDSMGNTSRHAIAWREVLDAVEGVFGYGGRISEMVPIRA